MADNRIGDLWIEAAELLNRSLKDASELPQFIEDYHTWKENVGVELAKRSSKCAGLWEVLGTKPLMKFPHAINPDHLNHLQIIAERVSLLSRILLTKE